MSWISGRSAEGALELDSGTTTMRSATVPVPRLSEEMTTAGRLLPGSPGLAAPNDTSQTSPRRGSVEAIAQRSLPGVHLLQAGWILGVCADRLPLVLEDRLARMFTCYLGQQRGKRYATLCALTQISSLLLTEIPQAWWPLLRS
jgi:hypothetical protein